jgi:hypothetical protein
LTPHHVTQRGNRRMALCRSSADFEFYRLQAKKKAALSGRPYR